MRDSAVRTALERIRRDEPATIEDQVRLCEIAAPPFKEQQRAEAYATMFRSLGLQNVRIDRAGNVLGDRPGLSARPHVVISAHLDTVFPEGTVVKVQRQGNILRAPGIADDCRGLAVVLAVVRGLNESRIETPGPITFVGTVGEEGLGDLRGVKHLFTEMKDRIDRFVSIDGSGFNITHVAVGSYRYRVTCKGPGGHSFGAFGLANPIHALGRAIAKISEFEVPDQPRTTFSVGRIGGGTSVNSIAYESWMEVDMRSSEREPLDELDRRFHEAVDRALEEENARWNGHGRLSMIKQRVGARPAGRLPETAPIVRAAVSTARTLNLPVVLREGSTDSNVPISLGIQAITIGGGGRASAAHSPAESFDSTDSWKGTQFAFLLTLTLARE
jgi:acetylornithine deacetylase/succinyl-diaminopimelate desuccinylase-like protein